MTQRTLYRITTEHPNGYRDGEHEVTVTTTKNHQTNRIQKSVSGGGFGCSRDYETPSDTIAITNLLIENGMRMTKMVDLTKNEKAKASRQARKEALDSIGVRQVKGALGGTYYE